MISSKVVFLSHLDASSPQFVINDRSIDGCTMLIGTVDTVRYSSFEAAVIEGAPTLIDFDLIVVTCGCDAAD